MVAEVELDIDRERDALRGDIGSLSLAAAYDDIVTQRVRPGRRKLEIASLCLDRTGKRDGFVFKSERAGTRQGELGIGAIEESELVGGPADGSGGGVRADHGGHCPAGHESTLACAKRQVCYGQLVVVQACPKPTILEIDAVLRGFDLELIAVDDARELNVLQGSVSGDIELQPAVDHRGGPRERLQRTQRRAVEVCLERKRRAAIEATRATGRGAEVRGHIRVSEPRSSQRWKKTNAFARPARACSLEIMNAGIGSKPTLPALSERTPLCIFLPVMPPTSVC